MTFAKPLPIRQIALVDPLRHVVERLLANAEEEDSPLWIGPGVFSERSDIRAITEAVRAGSDESRNPVLVDFSLVRAVGDLARMQPLLDAFTLTPFVAVVREGLATRAPTVFKNLPLVVLDDTSFAIQRHELDGLPPAHRKEVTELLAGGGPWTRAREYLVEHRMARLASTCLEAPPATHEYIPLPDGTAANKWIATKRLISSPVLAVECAYEMALRLTSYLERSSVEPTAFVSGNNTAYLLLCYLQRLLPDVPSFVIDRLGPYPHLSNLRRRDLNRLVGHRVCVVEDVISTGRELDLIHTYLRHVDAEVRSAFAVFDLEVARPLAAPANGISALCRASRYLDYRRFPTYMLEV